MNRKGEPLFFKDPATAPSFPGEFGTLYLLRRDIKSCMDHKILWPGTMCIMAGIDLLGKFLDGKDSNSVSGKRFLDFAKAYLHLSSKDAEPLYQLRNSLLHSFGLFSAKTGHYRFQLRANGNRAPIICRSGGKIIHVDVLSLNDGFEAAVNEYQKALHTSDSLRKNFNRMFRRYGKVPISQ